MARKKTPQQTVVEVFMTTDQPEELLEIARSIVKQRVHKPRKARAKKEAAPTSQG